jgi:hypothetical protein
MKELEVLDIEPTETLSNETKELLSNLNSGFEVLAKYNTLLGIFETYAEYLMNVKGCSIYKTNREVEAILNTMIENENMGSSTLIHEIKDAIFNKFKENSYKDKLITNIGKRLNSISERYTKAEVKSGLEQFELKADTDKLNQAKELVTFYVNEILEEVEKYFPEDFLGKIKD